MNRTRILQVALAFLVAKGIWDLAQVLLLELQGPLHADSLLYIEVGKGMINGLTPYVDLLESKPPGIFLLTALSLISTEGQRLASVVQVIGFASLPIVFLFFAHQVSKEKPSIERVVIIATAVFFGILLALYAERFAGALQTEGFGSVFGVIYVLLVALYRKKWSRPLTLVSSIFLLCSIGMKEPFLFSTLAASLLLVRSKRELTSVFLLPLLIALGMGALLLIVLGLFGPYTSDYLPLMLSKRITVDILDPLWVRGLQMQRIFKNMQATSFLLFPFLMTVMWLCIPLFRARVRSWKEVGLCVAVGAATFGIMYGTFLVSRVFDILDLHQLSKVPAFARIVFMYISALTVYGVMLYFLRKTNQQLFRNTLLAITALYILNLSVGVGGSYYDQHFIFALPVLAAVGFLFIQFLCGDDQPPLIPIILTAFIGLTILTVRFDAAHATNLRRMMENNEQSNRELTTQMNMLMESCEFDRYFAVGTNKFPFSNYSIVGPVFALQRYLQKDGPLHIRTSNNIRETADVIFIKADEQHESHVALPDNFTSTQPVCVENNIPPGFTVLFREKT